MNTFSGRRHVPPRVLVVLARAVDSVPSFVDENGAGVHIMYYLDGKRRRQSLVYFGKV